MDQSTGRQQSMMPAATLMAGVGAVLRVAAILALMAAAAGHFSEEWKRGAVFVLAAVCAAGSYVITPSWSTLRGRPFEDPPLNPRALLLFRWAITGASVMFGPMVFAMQKLDPTLVASPIDGSSSPVLFYGSLTVWAVVLSVLMVVHAKLERATTFERYANLTRTVWIATGMGALWGGSMYLLSGRPIWYFCGCLILVLAHTAFPDRAR